MDVGIAAGFGAPIGHELAGLAARGVQWVRQELHIWETDEVRRRLLAEFVGAPVRPHVLLVGAKMGHGRGEQERPVRVDEARSLVRATVQTCRELGLHPKLEIGNEPDIGVTLYRQPEHFSQLILSTRDAAREAGFTGPIVTGGLSNLNRRGMDFIRRVRQAGLPPDVWIGFHRYPAVHTDFAKPHAGFRDRAEEWDAFAAETVAHGFETVCTEGGCHTWESSPAHQASALEHELDFFAARGVRAYTVYQLNDAPTVQGYEDAWGIRDGRGQWKPAAETLRRWTEGHMGLADQQPIAAGMRIAAWRLVREDLGVCLLPDDQVVACTPEGRLETRPAGTTGPWELCRRDGDTYTFHVTPGGGSDQGFVFFLPGAARDA